MCKYIIVERLTNRSEAETDSVVGDYEAEGAAKAAAEEMAENNRICRYEVYQLVGQAALVSKVVWTGAKP